MCAYSREIEGRAQLGYVAILSHERSPPHSFNESHVTYIYNDDSPGRAIAKRMGARAGSMSFNEKLFIP